MKISVLSLMMLSLSIYAASPEWVNKLDTDKKLCKKDNEICAVGIGESESLAKSNARAEILKYFKTQISSKFTSELSLVGKEVSESSSERIEEITEGAISGIDIRKTDEDETNYYALAVLNKKNAAKILRNEITKLDEMIKTLSSSKDGKDIFEMEERYIERESIYERYLLVSKTKLPAPISFKEMFAKKKQITKNVLVKVTIEEEGKKLVSGLVKKELSALGYKSVANNQSHDLLGKFYPEKMYMNVDGFEKYNFILEITAQNKKGEKNTIKESFQTVGRDYDQAYSKAIESVSDYLNKNLKKINFN
ncbi:LPP20 lipoprotein [Bacteriovorax sp. BSW11_IV]|uniref:LPP20 family lipoprotein n=1 Tax=Bacteriovorax sp. BSW11_IV TaxID=1353529 RepID=UPI000389FB1A|nr:LPP20 family lipoprotein [Bacteriovorax sp. BSW11_IV]EQC42924.1 LPP20 lipoprotein [Bacteriovorax sp. BSW11_IV]